MLYCGYALCFYVVRSKEYFMIFSRPYSVVVIDDDPSILSMIELYLGSSFEGELRVHTYTSAQLAMDFICNHDTHIVITDLELIDKSGLDVISDCLTLHKGIQVMALSKDERMVTALDCYNRGARYFITKPIVKDDLINLFRNSIEYLDEWQLLIKEKAHLQERIS